MSFYLGELPYPAEPGWVFHAISALEAAVGLELHGEDDSSGPEVLVQRWNEQSDKTKFFVVALDGDPDPAAELGRFGLPLVPADPVSVLGWAFSALPRRDNPNLLDDCWILVDREHRRRGIGTALFQAVCRIGSHDGRRVVVGYSSHHGGEHPDGLVPQTGVGRIPRDAATGFAQSCGLSLEQVERRSVLAVPLPSGLLDRLAAEAEPHATGYRLVSWVGGTPEEWLTGVAQMQATVSSDAPTGGLDVEGELWDADRQRREDAVCLRTGVSYCTIAVHAATGEVAGFTMLHREFAQPTLAGQWNTAVAATHRGHRLGMLIKVANLRQLLEQEPAVTRIITYNAGENDQMLAINLALGFWTDSVSGAWQGTLAPEATG